MAEQEASFYPSFYQLTYEDGTDFAFEDDAEFMYEYASPVRFQTVAPS